MTIKMLCIRDIKKFRKTGCPCEPWDEIRGTGCPAWASMPAIDPNDKTKTIRAWNCIDILSLHQNHNILVSLAGIQNATETFRNGMVEEIGGEVSPKMSRQAKQALNVINAQLNQNTMIEIGGKDVRETEG